MSEEDVKYAVAPFTLQYWDVGHWVFVDTFALDYLAWESLGGDDKNYRLIDRNGNVVKCTRD
jgi:hypothetical protein